MKKHLLLVLAVLNFFFLSAQNNLSSIDVAVASFYEALATQDDALRQTRLKVLFTEKGQITSVNHFDSKPANIKSGTWQSFYSGSSDLYKTFSVSNDEVERNVDFYGDIASVNSLFYQTLINTSNSKKYAQLYWLQLELVFIADRWFIDYASWTNKYGNVAVEEAILSDTIWHKLSK